MKNLKKHKLTEKLCANNLSYKNMTTLSNKHNFSNLKCNLNNLPDYFALYSKPNSYQKTPKTCVSFFEYDSSFDGPNGLWNTMLYSNDKQLKQLKDRFKHVKYCCTPDYSIGGDFPLSEVIYRYDKARTISVWLHMEFGIEVIPVLSYGCESHFPLMIEGLENCSTIAISTKQAMKSKNSSEYLLLIKAIKYAVDHLNLRNIVVYNVCANIDFVKDTFAYATQKGINVIYPNNELFQRNSKRSLSKT